MLIMTLITLHKTPVSVFTRETVDRKTGRKVSRETRGQLDWVTHRKVNCETGTQGGRADR